MSFANPIRDEDVCISEALIARLHNAADDSVLELVAAFRASDRATLAMHCYRKSHLRRIGLTIASTCDLNILVQELGPGLGGAIFSQSRKNSEEPRRLWGRTRPAITLASSAGGSYPRPIESDDVSIFEESVSA